MCSMKTTMDHITRERLEELAGPSAGYDLEATAILSPEESVQPTCRVPEMRRFVCWKPSEKK